MINEKKESLSRSRYRAKGLNKNHINNLNKYLENLMIFKRDEKQLTVSEYVNITKEIEAVKEFLNPI